MAASVHGTVRAGKDASVLLSAVVLDGPKIERAFREAGFHTQLNHGDLEDDAGGLLEGDRLSVKSPMAATPLSLRGTFISLTAC